MATTVKNSRRRRFVTTMTAFFAISVMGVAFAAWVADGSGTGTATSRDHVAVTIDGTAEVADLYPGDIQDLSVEIDNSGNPYNITVTSITVEGTDDTPCTNPDFTFGAYTITGDALVVAGNDTATVTLADAVEMGHGSTNDCQDQVWELDLSFAGLSTGESATGDGDTIN